MFGIALTPMIPLLALITVLFVIVSAIMPGFGHLLLCFIKVAVIGLAYMLFTIDPIAYSMTFVVHLVKYLLAVIVKLLVSLLMFLMVAVVAFLDVIIGSFSGDRSTLGVRLFRILSLFNTCLNDPRGWFTMRRWHKDNRFVRAFGIYPCMTPCHAGYEPAPMSGGLTCKKMSLDSPDYCTAAAVTRVAEGMAYRPLPKVEVSSDDCRWREAGTLSENQKLLVQTVCQQPDEYENDFLRVPCYERYCANPVPGDTGPSTCENLVPFKSRGADVKRQLLMIVVLLVVGSQYFFTTVTAIRAKQDEYTQLNQSFVQKQGRFDL